jgi:hypothetical protein
VECGAANVKHYALAEGARLAFKGSHRNTQLLIGLPRPML